MYLTKNEKCVSVPSWQVSGFAGWVMQRAHMLWLEVTTRREAKKRMCVIETLSMGGKKQLVLVSCGDEQFLVGTGGDSVQTIVRVGTERTQDKNLPARDAKEWS